MALKSIALGFWAAIGALIALLVVGCVVWFAATLYTSYVDAREEQSLKAADAAREYILRRQSEGAKEKAAASARKMKADAEASRIRLKANEEAAATKKRLEEEAAWARMRSQLDKIRNASPAK